jgi:HopJ type III effector protein
VSIQPFLHRVKNGERVTFAETQSLIDQHYRYTAIGFSNGVEGDRIVSDAGVNEGSCKIFYFAQLHQLGKEATLGLFGDYYWLDVLQNPQGHNHANIRNFIKYGWDGIRFSGTALTPREPE